jgi:CheY-like chemotaxis protein
VEHRVLFVDDEDAIREALEFLVMDEGWQVLSAESGPKALEILEHTSVSMIVSDYRMPGMDGVELLREVHQRHPSAVKMILSGYAEAHAIVAAINEGHCDKFIGKPWDDEQLLEILRWGLKTFEENSCLSAETENLRIQTETLRQDKEQLEARVTVHHEEATQRGLALDLAHEILDRLPYALFGLDTDGTLVLTNNAGRDFCPALMFGMPLETWLTIEEAVALTKEVLEDGKPRSANLVRPDGRVQVDCISISSDGPERGVLLVMRKEGTNAR